MKKRHYLYLGLTAGFILGMFCGIVAAHAKDHGASAVMPITATIIQCGTKYEALGQCLSGVTPCCAFAPIDEVVKAVKDNSEVLPEQLNEIAPAAGYPDIDVHGTAASVENTDDGVIVNFE
ncbi:MAG: hypothetical protein WC130_03695 [Kiritimatiellia bacterium]